MSDVPTSSLDQLSTLETTASMDDGDERGIHMWWTQGHVAGILMRYFLELRRVSPKEPAISPQTWRTAPRDRVVGGTGYVAGKSDPADHAHHDLARLGHAC